MFSPNTLDFLSENFFMNSRTWYHEHKEDYKHFVHAPMVEMVERLAPTMELIDDRIITEPKIDKTISRIYRDSRRAKGQFFREELWLSFKRDKHMFPGYPDYFFAFTPRDFCYGCGYYACSAETMQCLRQMVLENHPAYLAAQKAVESQRFFVLSGQRYKRSRFPDQPEQKKAWLDRKFICLIHDGDPITDLFREDLCEKVGEAFLTIKPVYDLFIAAEQMANELQIF